MLARLAVLAVAALTFAAPAFAKGDVTATIVTPVPADAEPGTPTRVLTALAAGALGLAWRRRPRGGAVATAE